MLEDIILSLVTYGSLTAFLLGTFFFLIKGLQYRKESSTQTEITVIPNYKISEEINRTNDLITRKLIPGGELTHSASEIGLGNIEFLLSKIIQREEKRPHLFGINKGGAFIANYLAHRMSLHEKYLVKCDYRPDFKKFYCEDRAINGPIVIVDDVIRTGKTIAAAKNYLSQKYPGKRIYSFVLIVTQKDTDTDNPLDIIDYSPWITDNEEISLPWTANKDKEISKDDINKYFNDKEMDQIVGRIDHKTI